MARITDDEDEEWHDDWSDDDDEPTITCPYCGCDVHEDSPRCPQCANYISREDMPSPRRPWWFLIGAGLGLLVFLRWLFL